MNSVISSILLVLVGLIVGIIIMFIANFIRKNSANDKADKIIENARNEAMVNEVFSLLGMYGFKKNNTKKRK